MIRTCVVIFGFAVLSVINGDTKQFNHGVSMVRFSGSVSKANGEISADTANTPSKPEIQTFTVSAPFVQRPAFPTLSWTVTGPVTSLQIVPRVGDVRPLTFKGSGCIAVKPIGEQTYTLICNGTSLKSVSVVGLPDQNKLYLYLLIGQSNMHGAGGPYDAELDVPLSRVIKFGSFYGMEPVFVKGGHPLTQLNTSAGGYVGMGVEFGKAIIAAQTDPEVVVCLINHAIGSSAIQWWAPGVVDSKQINVFTGKNLKLYDEAVERVRAALKYGVLKGVLWHQGENNAIDDCNADPPPEPECYASRLKTLVTNLRTSFADPTLPFVCGKLVPAKWVNEKGDTNRFCGLPRRDIVEKALVELPSQVKNTFCVDNDGLKGYTENWVHFDAASLRELGRRYAAALLTIGTIGQPTTFTGDSAQTHNAGYQMSSNASQRATQVIFNNVGPHQMVDIYSLSGAHAGTFNAQGGRVVWNWHSKNHGAINSGIYIARITSGKALTTETIRVTK
jgi:hypothetical protein